MAEFNSDRDDFWDLSKIVPKKKNPGNTQFVTNRQTHEVNVDGDAVRDDDRKINFDSFKIDSEPIENTYFPDERGLIKRVTITKFVDKYDFYGNFRKAALIYFDYKTDKCDFAPYFSFMPQYSQLTDRQRAYYFYWRYEFKNNRIIKSDYSYIYLFVYEILNLPDKISPESGIEMLCRLWRDYRKVLPRIDYYFSIWIQDYCLIYNVKPRLDIIGDFLSTVVSSVSFKEFYISVFDSNTTEVNEVLLAYLSDYDWRRGKFSSEGKDEKYKKLMLLAMDSIIKKVLIDFNEFKTVNTSLINRTAFPHSLCTHSVKCNLEVEYYPISTDETLRAAITQGVRYTENKLRGLYGIKSRIAVKGLPEEYKDLIDDFFERIAYSSAKKNAQKNIPEYEKLYDAPSGSMNQNDADEIEKLSWTNTYRLVENCEETEDSNETLEQTEMSSDNVTENSVQNDGFFGLSDSDVGNVLLSLDVGFSDDTSAERINEAFADNFGDVILEFDGEKYIIISDYKEDIEEWLTK